MLLQDMVSTEEMRKIWSEENMLQKWIDVERAITEAQSKLGMIPQGAAKKILEKLSIQHLCSKRIYEKKKNISHIMVSFIKAFREICGTAAEHFHIGPTTQDILDTGLTLQMKEAHNLIMNQMYELEQILCDRALEHKNTVMMGRTHQQHAVPCTFGFILAIWASEIRDHIERARESEKRWLLGNLTGMVGSQNAFVELAGIKTTTKLQKMVCNNLNLKSPMIDLHSRTDRFSGVISNLAQLCSSLGKIGINISNWQRSEVMEVQEPHDEMQSFSSTNPNKINPDDSEQVEGLAKLVRCHALAMQDIQMLDNRDASRMPVLFVTIPLNYMMASKAISTTIKNLAGLVVHDDIMFKNMVHANVLGQTIAERLMIAMYKKTGEKIKAYDFLNKYAKKSRRERRLFRDVLAEEEYFSILFDEKELERLFDITTYTGTATYQCENAIKIIGEKRKNEISEGILVGKNYKIKL